MDNIKVHVTNYDANTNAVTVFFESDVTSNTGSYVYQMHNISGNTFMQKLGSIAKSGFYTVEAKIAAEKDVANTDLQKAYKLLEGNAYGFSRNDLWPPTSNSTLTYNLTDVTNS